MSYLKSHTLEVAHASYGTPILSLQLPGSELS